MKNFKADVDNKENRLGGSASHDCLKSKIHLWHWL